MAEYKIQVTFFQDDGDEAAYYNDPNVIANQELSVDARRAAWFHKQLQTLCDEGNINGTFVVGSVTEIRKPMSAQAAYALYLEYCGKIQIKPLGYDAWKRQTRYQD